MGCLTAISARAMRIAGCAIVSAETLSHIPTAFCTLAIVSVGEAWHVVVLGFTYR